ncbi:EAL domain-containing protein [Thiomicrorhabdus aquaedulcis]|uniref:EAL domain-containing protein n=1 Tax=Thiomicrorhabdus aquaedulcis TaxID=2211106 RepID=UPI000FD70C51|nr:EAL domain-containing protein [Thiomicrorhabdus aquaedulcis]
MNVQKIITFWTLGLWLSANVMGVAWAQVENTAEQSLVAASVNMSVNTPVNAVINSPIDTPVKKSVKSSYVIGVLAFRDKAQTALRWQPLADYLQASIVGTNFSIAAFHNDEMEQRVAAGDVDFVLTQPAQYVLLTYRSSLTSPLASMLNLEGDFVTEHFGGVIFTLAHRDDITTLKHIKGKLVAGASTTSLGAYQMQAFELLQHGIRLPRDAKVVETGQPQRNAIDAVLSGRADVGFVRTGVIEDLVKRGELDMSRLKLLNAQRYPDFPFVTSTPLYPEWPFAAQPFVNKDMARQVSSALLAMPREGAMASSMDIAGFTISGDYRTIDVLMRELQLEPFNNLGYSIKEVLEWWFVELLIGLIVFLVAITLIISLLLKQQRQLKLERNRLMNALEQVRVLNQAVEQSPESLVITDTQGRVTYMNPMFELITGYKMDEVKGQNPRILQSGQTPKSVYESMWQALNTGKVWRGELINKRKNGELYPSQAIISPVKNESGHTTHFLAIQHDISQRKNREQRIQELLYVDSVTGLANRNKLLEVMDKSLHRTGVAPVKGCLVLLNLARFKFVNQLHGVDVGDAVLSAMAQRLEQAYAQTGLVARLAADDFAVFCDNKADFEQIDEWLLMMGQRALLTFEQTLEVKGEFFKLQLSVGVSALMVNKAGSAEAINNTLNQAGMALKQAKQKGANQLVVFNEALMTDSVEKHQLQQALAAGIEKDELRLFVQPQFNQCKDLVGLECLVRWQHPQKGLLLPVHFILLAEESDIIVSLGNWVLRQACVLLTQLQSTHEALRVAVNISPRHFRQAGFIQTCQTILAQTGANPHGLMLEITENLFLDEFDEVVDKMNQLKALGIRFSIDDFGTGYSSLSYLQHLPVDELKIDRAFLLAMTQYGFERSLVASIYAMGQKMKLTVVAEGVETQEQLNQLSELEHLELQGFLLAKPQASNDWLASWKAEHRL